MCKHEAVSVCLGEEPVPPVGLCLCPGPPPASGWGIRCLPSDLSGSVAFAQGLQTPGPVRSENQPRGPGNGVPRAPLDGPIPL